MTETEQICKELMTQGLKNICKQVYNEQYNDEDMCQYTSTLEEIEDFLNRMAVIEPFATLVNGKEMFRVTHIIGKSVHDKGYAHMDISKLEKRNIFIYMDKDKEYHIIVNGQQPDRYSIYSCPPTSKHIALAMFTKDQQITFEGLDELEIEIINDTKM